MLERFYSFKACYSHYRLAGLNFCKPKVQDLLPIGLGFRRAKLIGLNLFIAHNSDNRQNLMRPVKQTKTRAASSDNLGCVVFVCYSAVLLIYYQIY